MKQLPQPPLAWSAVWASQNNQVVQLELARIDALQQRIYTLETTTQPKDDDLTALAALSDTGIVRRTGAGAFSAGSTVSVGEGGTGATTLTGYVKGNGTSAMTALATIPVADVSGAAVDSAVVHLTGNETIAGIKTFTDGNGIRHTSGGTVVLELIGRDDLGYCIVGSDTDHDVLIRRNNAERIRATSAGAAVTGTLGVTGAASFNGAMTLGDSAGDAITINGRTTYTDTQFRWSGGVLSILPLTSDGSDTSELYIDGGGAASASRGAWIGVYGNEHGSRAGDLRLHAGNVTGGAVTIAAGADADVVAVTSGAVSVTGTITGSSTIEAAKAFYVADVYQISASTGGAARTLDISNSEVQTLVADSDFTLTVTGPAGKSARARLYLYVPIMAAGNITVSYSGVITHFSETAYKTQTCCLVFEWDGTRAWRVARGDPTSTGDYLPS